MGVGGFVSKDRIFKLLRVDGDGCVWKGAETSGGRREIR